MADVKDVSRMYLPPVPDTANEKADVVTKIVKEVAIEAQQDAVDNDLKVNSLESLTKDAINDPAYGFPGGFPGGFPAVNPGQSYPGQGLPPQIFPGQGVPPQVFPPPPGFVMPNYPGQGFPGQGFPGQGFPGQAFPTPVYPGQVPYPGQAPFPGQFYPGQVYPGQGFPYTRYPAGFVNPAYPGYPLYQSNEALKKEESNDESDDKNLRLRLVASDTQYDADNGGYLYKKPSVAF